jgi:hypothetical protein
MEPRSVWAAVGSAAELAAAIKHAPTKRRRHGRIDEEYGACT